MKRNRRNEVKGFDLEKSAEVNPNLLTDNAIPSSKKELESVVKTTDSINILSNTNDLNVVNNDSRDFYFVREAILHSYDLARRKITSEYKYVVDSGNFIDNQFFATQLTIKNFDKKWDIQFVNSIINKFTQAVVENIAIGKTIYITDELVIEPIVYYHKILPAWKTTPSFALLTNALTWKSILEKLIEERKVTISAEEVITEYILALATNIKNGYYVKLDRFIILQIAPKSDQKVVLFSNDTLSKLNAIYSKVSVDKREESVNRYDVLEHFSYNQKKIEGAILAEKENKRKAQLTVERKFVPRDLTEELELTKIVDLQVKSPLDDNTGVTQTNSIKTKTIPSPVFEEDLNPQGAADDISSTKNIKLVDAEKTESILGDEVASTTSEEDSNNSNFEYTNDANDAVNSTSTLDFDGANNSSNQIGLSKAELKREKKLKKQEAKKIKKDLKRQMKEEKRALKAQRKIANNNDETNEANDDFANPSDDNSSEVSSSQVDFDDDSSVNNTSTTSVNSINDEGEVEKE